MEYGYEIIEIKERGFIVDYYPPVEFVNEIGVTRIRLPSVVDSLTDEAEIRTRIESAAPIEDWEELLDLQDNAITDFQDLINSPRRLVTLPEDLAAKSRRTRDSERVVEPSPEVVSGQVEV